MLDLSRRADLDALPEWMDAPCSYAELRACLRDIAKVNRLTMAHRPTMAWLDEVAGLRGVAGPLRIVDVGCGYGDMLRRIAVWAKVRGVGVELVGVDLNADAVRAAKEAAPAGSGIEFVAGDAYSCSEAEGADVVISSLLTHHLEEAEIVRFLQWMERTARVGWFVNDLHRQAVPYYCFGAMTAGPRWHRFIRHDGMVSIRRSFVREDWRRMCAAAGVVATISERRPARLCVGSIRKEMAATLCGGHQG